MNDIIKKLVSAWNGCQGLEDTLDGAINEIERLLRVEAAQLCFMCSERVDRQILPVIYTLEQAISAVVDRQDEGFTSVKAAKMMADEIGRLRKVIDGLVGDV